MINGEFYDIELNKFYYVENMYNVFAHLYFM